VRWKALACDYDRTLTDAGLQPHPGALAALREAQRAGLKVLVVSGRPLALLRGVVPFADAVVAENGAVTWRHGQEWRAPWPARERVLSLLGQARRGHEHEPFRVLVSLRRAEAGDLEQVLGEAWAQVQTIPNVDSVMLLPPGVDKATGMRAALEGLCIAPADAVAIGDGENDVPMLRAAGLAAAPANAVPEAKAEARLLLSGACGDAIPELVAWLLARAAPPP
jgi:hydroxymethylpyrimidine pyrophosphatase-like HAD family hydrolase